MFSHQAIVELHDSDEHFFTSIEAVLCGPLAFFVVVVVAKTGNFIEQLRIISSSAFVLLQVLLFHALPVATSSCFEGPHDILV